MANGQTGDLTAHAVSLVNQELNSEQEPVRENYTEEKIVPEMTKTQEHATPMSIVQSMANGQTGDLTAHAVSLVKQELISEQEPARENYTEEKTVPEVTKNQEYATLMSIVQSMANGQTGDLTAHAVSLVKQELISEQEPARENYTEEKTVPEVTKNQEYATLMSIVQSMANGQTGDLTAHAVSLVKQELISEQEPARENYTEERIVPEVTKNQEYATPKSIVQSMVNGQTGDLTAHAVSLVKQELISEQEPARENYTEEKIVPEVTKNQEYATLMSIVQSMANGQTGALTAHAVSLVKQELISEQEPARENYTEERIVPEVTKNQEYATLMSIVQSMVNGQTGDLTAHAVSLVKQELISEQEPARENYTEEKIVPEVTKNQEYATLMSIVQSMANGQTGNLTAHAVSLVKQELISEQEHVRENYTEEKIVPEMTKNQEYATPKSNVQLMANGQHGDLTAHAVSLVKQELISEQDPVNGNYTEEKIVPEMTKNQEFATPMSNVQSMENGQTGDHTAHAVSLVNQELISEQEHARENYTEEKTVPEMTKNQEFATQMSTVQSMENGQAGDLTAHAVSLVKQELISEQEHVRENYTEEKIVPEMTKNREYATPTSNVQSMANGQTGDLTARAVSLVKQELNSEQEPARENYTEEKIVPEMTKNREFVTPKSNVQSMENGQVGDHTARAVSLVKQELISEQEHVRENYTEEKIVLEMTKNREFATPKSNVQSMENGQVGDHTACVVSLVKQELISEQEHARENYTEEKIVLEMTKNQEHATPMSNVQLMENGQTGDHTARAVSLVKLELISEQEPVRENYTEGKIVPEMTKNQEYATPTSSVQSMENGQTGDHTAHAVSLVKLELISEQEPVRETGKLHGGKDCAGDNKDSRICDTKVKCPVDGEWSSWSTYTSCSESCGKATKSRTRTCKGKLYGGKDCIGLSKETKICDNLKPCGGTCFDTFIDFFLINFVAFS